MPRRTEKPGSGFTLTIDAIPMPAAALDAQHGIICANAPFHDLFGAAVAPGRTLREMLEIAGVESTDTRLGRIFRIKRKRGVRAFQLMLKVNGEGSLVCLSELDQSRAKREEVRVAEDIRARLMHDAEIGLWRYDPDTDMYQFSSELSLGHADIGAPVPRAQLQLIQHRDDRAKDDAIRQRITTEGGAAESEMRYLSAEGGFTHLRVLYRSGAKLPSGRY